ncbi:peroxiredoxin-like family protein [Kitasatospora sp. NPDC088134]|uniref:peroxiredoxin-like family protein n=1 Tax=Kitasatospora sp. NPDC088134 TaxID=3364071 RepID=UPI003825FD40
MSVNAELRAFYDLRRQQIPEPARAVMERAARELAGSGLVGRALAVGDRAPGFALRAAAGGTVELAELLADGPVVLTFYRGAWCPYCNIALRSLQQHHAAVLARGARLVAVSPQLPDESLTSAEKNELAFPVLSDPGCAVAEQYGLAFDLPDDLAAVYAAAGIDLERSNGARPRTLPVPATYVIDRSGTVRWAFVDTDHTVRAEPADVLAALDRLG